MSAMRPRPRLIDPTGQPIATDAVPAVPGQAVDVPLAPARFLKEDVARAPDGSPLVILAFGMGPGPLALALAPADAVRLAQAILEAVGFLAGATAPGPTLEGVNAGR